MKLNTCMYICMYYRDSIYWVYMSTSINGLYHDSSNNAAYKYGVDNKEKDNDNVTYMLEMDNDLRLLKQT